MPPDDNERDFSRYYSDAQRFLNNDFAKHFRNGLRPPSQGERPRELVPSLSTIVMMGPNELRVSALLLGWRGAFTVGHGWLVGRYFAYIPARVHITEGRRVLVMN